MATAVAAADTAQAISAYLATTADTAPNDPTATAWAARTMACCQVRDTAQAQGVDLPPHVREKAVAAVADTISAHHEPADAVGGGWAAARAVVSFTVAVGA